MSHSQLRQGDVLVIVDVQNDFVTGSLAVPGAADIIAPLNRYIALFVRSGLRVVATRDWHPASHMSFREQGGPWPPHCVARTPGAAFAPGLHLPEGAWLVSKATSPSRDAYSGFERTDFDHRLKGFGAKRLFVGGLATDYCVLRTVLDSLARGYITFVLEDAIRAVDVNPGDGDNAVAAMQREGAAFLRYEELLEDEDFSP
ncbi:MAG: isochorismatase family protein [Betaproteobacteria bacterium]|nr:isochorismatase family protein [Betaproteobacteria bacterium]